MFLQFFTSLRDAQVPVTLREYLTLMEALDADLAEQSVDNFYYLSRAALVKDERWRACLTRWKRPTSPPNG
jgi:uncharacterized protein with von Willebrand factor type A (vWA) domain